MLVICEDCSKKYTIDVDKMKSSRAKFACYECGFIIVVEKEEPSSTPSLSQTSADTQAQGEPSTP